MTDFNKKGVAKMGSPIYPEGGRENAFAGLYCKIAMENYYRASEFYKEIKSAQFAFEKIAEQNEFNKRVISTVVFSSMCLEAFFNDYIAAVLGDKKFYDVYDSLTPRNKFCLIVTFIFQTEIDKASACYGGITNLFRLRNDYVHNKSRQTKFQGYTAEQFKEIKKLHEGAEKWFVPPSLNEAEIEKDMRDALEALKTIRNVARYFDKCDSACYAMVRLFGEHNYYIASSYEKKYMEEIFRKLGIKKGVK